MEQAGDRNKATTRQSNRVKPTPGQVLFFPRLGAFMIQDAKMVYFRAVVLNFCWKMFYFCNTCHHHELSPSSHTQTEVKQIELNYDHISENDGEIMSSIKCRNVQYYLLNSEWIFMREKEQSTYLLQIVLCQRRQRQHDNVFIASYNTCSFWSLTLLYFAEFLCASIYTLSLSC